MKYIALCFFIVSFNLYGQVGSSSSPDVPTSTSMGSVTYPDPPAPDPEVLALKARILAVSDFRYAVTDLGLGSNPAVVANKILETKNSTAMDMIEQRDAELQTLMNADRNLRTVRFLTIKSSIRDIDTLTNAQLRQLIRLMAIEIFRERLDD